MMQRKRKLDVGDPDPIAPPSKQVALENSLNGGGPNSDAPSQTAVNPYTGKIYSQTYWTIMQKRRTLPVWQAKADFLELI